MKSINKTKSSNLATIEAISFCGGPEASGAIKDIADSGTKVVMKTEISASQNRKIINV